MAGETETGISIMQMDAGMDTGSVYRTRSIPIASDDTAGSLTEKLAILGARLLTETLPEIIAGTLAQEPQDDSQATYAPLLSKQDGRLDFSRAAVELERRVRGLSPWPNTFTNHGPTTVQVLAASVELEGARGAPGEVVEAGARGIVVVCGDDALRLEQVKPAGKKAMAAGAWVAGRGIEVGTRLA